ncbi:glutathione S-transferase family protein [Phyllobacterium sp. SB3]|uniref:glutathione S-transferase family protein n=1 Tax=Phyllobacterium sp. SB3 TaxID=3156073 RepID=UPI0032AF899D
MRLYLGFESGNSYKIRVLLSLLNLQCEIVTVNIAKHEHKSSLFRHLNPRGQVPVLEDKGRVFWDSSAALVYIAGRFGGEAWLPRDPADLAEVTQWLALSGNEIQFGLQYARRGVKRGRWIAGSLEELQAIGRLGLEALESRLAAHPWLCFNRLTIADIACFPYVEQSPEANIPLDPYPGIEAWLLRCRALPHWPSREVDRTVAIPFN